ncbi:MAG: bifunctional folylpolyglutamate synthase/dihydrofolate synthase [Candidatus Shapirobacteria bacterium]|nr:bifunctional folylpolyglutamate synthase/dihydrofolate synthase [Candidatus Shapirobacteria bacterium]MDD5481912.1 bifunctional folylpolyglutamate synthase/dihydrofolate synthase [Candidatus Shapirobacteria bacterium]
MIFKTLPEAQNYLFAQINNQKKGLSPAYRLSRTREILKRLGNPQEKPTTIHIAGTAGKGSTAYLTSLILESLGFKVGLHLSPHLVDIRERFQINNRLISEQKFLKHLNRLVPVLEKTGKNPWGKPDYFEILTILAFEIFHQEKVDYVIVETGLGGLYDSTNTIENPQKISVITKIGLDHCQILGNTLAEIAFQKMGIVLDKSTVIAGDQRPAANWMIKKIAEAKQAQLIRVEEKRDFQVKRVDFGGTGFSYQGRSLNLGLIGRHQAQNCALALKTIEVLSDRGQFNLSWPKIRKALAKAYFPGRLEVIKKNNQKIILDGAHNEEKMAALIQTLEKVFPQKKFNFLIAFKKDKEVKKMIKEIIPLAHKITISSIFSSNSAWQKLAYPPEEVKKLFHNFGFYKTTVICKPKRALKNSLDNDRPLIVTGSLYLVGEISPLLRQS